MCRIVLKFVIFLALGAYVLAAPPFNEKNNNTQTASTLKKQPAAAYTAVPIKDDTQYISSKDDHSAPEEDNDDDDLGDDDEIVNQQVSGPAEEVTQEPVKSDNTMKTILICPKNVTICEPKSTDLNKKNETLTASGELPNNLNDHFYKLGPQNPFGGLLVHGVPVVYDDPKSPIHRIYYEPKA